MFYRSFNTTKEMMERLTTEYMFAAPGSDLYTVSHFDRVYTSPFVVEIEHPTPDLDLGLMGWTESRWQKFCSQYLGEPLKDWANSCVDTLPVTSELGYQFETKAHHDNGNCVVYMTFRNNPQPCITLLSRAAHLVPTSCLELSLCNILASRFQAFFGEPVKLVWMAAQVQFSAMWAFPYLERFWYPKYKEQADYWQNQSVKPLGLRGWNSMMKRYNLFTEDGTLPKYGRTGNMFKRTAQAYPEYIPTKIYINGEWL